MAGTLELSPKFQRRPVWTSSAKSYFIDSILRGFPVPPIHIRLYRSRGGAMREIIDGQQRLRAVFDYIEDKFSLSSTVSSDWSGKRFSDLSEDEQERIQMYKFHAFQYDLISDAQVLEIFSRMNTYSVRLSSQELRHGRYFGEFKSTIDTIARDHLEFWRRFRIFSENSIARMQEVEFTAELAIMMMDGFQDKKKSIDAFYGHLDASWGGAPVMWEQRKGRPVPYEYISGDEVAARIDRVLGLIDETLGDIIVDSPFKRVPLFYTLFSVLYHRLYGVPQVPETLGIGSPARDLESHDITSLRDGVASSAEALHNGGDGHGLSWRESEFVRASSRQTDNLGPRLERFHYLWSESKLGKI
ncbi:DUF262 domain-containing protein [Micrococcus sp.]|nr:DUF262 domain-containing protein [Micrococcus sp.]MDO4239550.1 DUF262 domain-containing protein [Micrococcus sp.]